MRSNIRKKDINSDEELRTFSIRINSIKLNKKILSYLRLYRHFENTLLILIKQNYELYTQGKDTNDFKYLTDSKGLRIALLDYNTKNSTVFNYLNEKYKDNELWQTLKEVAKVVEQHNLGYLINRVKGNYKTYFTKIQRWKKNSSLFTGMPKPPRAKKLSKMTNYSVELDRYTTLSFAQIERKNLVGVNLAHKMLYIRCSDDLVKKITDVSKLYSVKIVYDNGLLYLSVSYLKKLNKNIPSVVKEAGIDIGINNLASIFVNDKTTPSLIVDGKPFKHYNAKFNRLIAKLNESKSQEVVKWKSNKLGSKYPLEYSQRGKDINKFVSFLYAKRNRYFFDQFHKVSKRIVEYLKYHNVTDVYLSKTLAELKSNGNCKLSKSVKQSFIEIPFIKLLKNIEYKAQEIGINVHWINEAYSSKSSCISDNVIDIQNSPQLTNAFNGKRVKRGLFLDTAISKVFNADINGAVNHIKIGINKSFEWLKEKLFKLCNPIKIKSDYEFCKLLKGLQNSVSGKSMFVENIEALESTV
jgi:IS605 OrfB family transposase